MLILVAVTFSLSILATRLVEKAGNFAQVTTLDVKFNL